MTSQLLFVQLTRWFFLEKIERSYDALPASYARNLFHLLKCSHCLLSTSLQFCILIHFLSTELVDTPIPHQETMPTEAFLQHVQRAEEAALGLLKCAL